jgi:hypothetical protein
LQVGDVEIRVGSLVVAPRKGSQCGLYRGHRPGTGRVTGHAFQDVDPGALTVAFVTEEEKRLLPDDRTADGTAKLIEA